VKVILNYFSLITKEEFGKNHLSRCIRLLTFSENIQEKEVSIHICLDKKKNHIHMDLANQLIIPKTNVIETKDFFFAINMTSMIYR
jgi:hypothetical protein